jgi:hypothetical protein
LQKQAVAGSRIDECRGKTSMETQLLGDRFSSRYEVQQQLGKRFSLTEPEVDWLASQLRDWLGMPSAKE